jgi:GT2 family glycosyltransferase
MAPPAVSIVIPTWNGLDLLKRFLPSVRASAEQYAQTSEAGTEIIVVDDGSEDQTAVWLEQQGFRGQTADQSIDATSETADSLSPVRLRFLRSPVNQGFGSACNLGFIAAGNSLVLLLNNDVQLEPDAIAPLVENFADDRLFAVHCRVFELESGRECGVGKIGSFGRGFIRVHRSWKPCDGARQADGNPGLKGAAEGFGDSSQAQTTGSPRRQGYYSIFAGGGSAMFKRKFFLELGEFEPLLAPFYWEDVELSYRAWKRGYRVAYEPRSIARHQISSTIGKLDKGRVRAIQQRNRLIYHWIHLHDRGLLASHLVWVAFLAVTAPIRFRPGFIKALANALRKLPQVRARRQMEKNRAKLRDREVFEVFRELEERPDVVCYDDSE